MKLHQHFEIIRQLIRIGRTQTLQMAYAGQLKVYWQVVHMYISNFQKLKNSGFKIVGSLTPQLQTSLSKPL